VPAGGGALVVQLAVARNAIVVATAGPTISERVRDYGAQLVFDYHDPDWPARVRDASPGGCGVAAAVNTARGQAATALRAVADGGRLATITGDPPPREREVAITDVFVQADGARLAGLVTSFAEGCCRSKSPGLCHLQTPRQRSSAQSLAAVGAQACSDSASRRGFFQWARRSAR
jgi:hypothetical protein